MQVTHFNCDADGCLTLTINADAGASENEAIAMAQQWVLRNVANGDMYEMFTPHCCDGQNYIICT